MFTVLLDNGHGVNTPGKCSPKKPDGTRFREYKWARTLVECLSLKLKMLGYNVFTVTPEQEDISLGERVRRINKVVSQYGASNCIMISIHVDAAGSNDTWMSARGWTAYTTRG
jgi:N-acetylmuramoyl-L-alanine amidase